ncbi:hypothetical protein ES708_24625 [subsurface metagenome]
MLLGLTICWLIIPHVAISVRFALAYSLGFGFLTLAMFFLNVLGLKFSLLNTTILVSAIIGILLVFRGKRNWANLLSVIKVNPFARMKQIMASLSAFEKILLGLLLFFLLSHLVIAVYWPVLWSDSLTLYDLRAKLLFEEQSFPGAVARFEYQLLNIARTSYVFSHAPMTSLVHTWFYLCGWASPKIFYPLLFISLAILFYHFLRHYVPRYHALLFTLILTTTPYIYAYATSSYPHFTVAFYFSIGTFFLYRWVWVQKRSFLLLAGIFLGLSSWVRQLSGIFFLAYLIILLFVAVSRRRFFAPFFLCLPYFSVALLWSIYSQKVLPLGAVGQDGTPGASQVFVFLPMVRHFFNFLRWKEVLSFVWKYVSPNFRVIYALLIFTSVLYVDRVWKHRFLFLIIISNLSLFVLGIYIEFLTPGHPPSPSSAERITIMFLPIIWYFIALITVQRKVSAGSKSNA